MLEQALRCRGSSFQNCRDVVTGEAGQVAKGRESARNILPEHHNRDGPA